jgi:spore coat polysaccharide biosynthesis protein SpsF (cytidylyltransferase family)
MKNIIIVIQARLTSSRFPKKILKKIAKKTLLEIMYLRLGALKKKYKIIFVIPNNKKNLQLKKFLKKKKIPFGVGSEKNVLKRIYNICLKLTPEIVVRLTSDCPLIDPHIINSMILRFNKHKKIDYMGNTTVGKKKYPDGTDVEIFKFSILKKTYKLAKSKYDKEHVTSYMQKKFKTTSFEPKKDYSNKKWSIDTKQDLKYVKEIFKNFNYNFKISFKEIIKKNF